MSLSSTISELLQKTDKIVWGPYMIALLLGTGIYLLIKMRFLPVRNLGYALKCLVKSGKDFDGEGEISAVSSLATELAATIGTGNIVGVATAMTLGGAGALVWLLLSAFAGFSTKFAESMLSVKYRTKNADKITVGGPMYTLKAAFPFKKTGAVLGAMFAVFAVLASFGMGNMAQSNSITSALREAFSIPVHKSGIVVSILVILVILGGIQSISRFSLYMVPAMALFYVGGALAVIIVNIDGLTSGLKEIFTMAFSVRAVAGGIGGTITASMQDAMRYGISRGVFSNEAGLGAGGISAAAADTASCVKQGYISMTGVFFDTIVICTVTGLAIASSGVLGICDENNVPLTGAALTIAAFSTVFGDMGACIVSIGITLFAFATIIAWEYQGERAFEYLVKKSKLCIVYRFTYALATFIGAVCTLETVWNFSDIMNALMAIPNLLCVLALSDEVCGDMIRYDKER